MKKFVARKKYLHQSYFLLTFCLGTLIGIILTTINRGNFLLSPAWILFSILIFVFSMMFPKFSTMAITLIAGTMVGYVRGVWALKNGALTIDQWDFVVKIRDWFAARISGAIPSPESKLGVAYLLGVKENLPSELNDSLKAIGLAHIVVASGAHLSILVDLVKKIFGKVSRFAMLFFALMFILLFMVMVGWTPSIMRAGIMSALSLIAWYTGRRFTPWKIILITMTITLLIDPNFLTNLGWLLSFASYGGIMILGPLITKYFYGDTKPNFVASIIITTFAATLATLPITLYFFGSFSIVAVVANLLILPTLPYAMGLVFCSGLCFGVPILGEVTAWLATKLLDFHIAVVNFFAKQTYFIVSMPIKKPVIFILYLPILACGFLMWRKTRKHKRDPC